MSQIAYATNFQFFRCLTTHCNRVGIVEAQFIGHSNSMLGQSGPHLFFCQWQVRFKNCFLYGSSIIAVHSDVTIG